MNILKNCNPVEIRKMIDNGTIEYTVEQTNLYAVQRNRHNFSVSSLEMRKLLAIHLLSGYHQLPQERMY